jgi:hypothetical protein
VKCRGIEYGKLGFQHCDAQVTDGSGRVARALQLNFGCPVVRFFWNGGAFDFIQRNWSCPKRSMQTQKPRPSKTEGRGTQNSEIGYRSENLNSKGIYGSSMLNASKRGRAGHPPRRTQFLSTTFDLVVFETALAIQSAGPPFNRQRHPGIPYQRCRTRPPALAARTAILKSSRTLSSAKTRRRRKR